MVENLDDLERTEFGVPARILLNKVGSMKYLIIYDQMVWSQKKEQIMVSEYGRENSPEY